MEIVRLSVGTGRPPNGRGWVNLSDDTSVTRDAHDCTELSLRRTPGSPPTRYTVEGRTGRPRGTEFRTSPRSRYEVGQRRGPFTTSRGGVGSALREDEDWDIREETWSFPGSPIGQTVYGRDHKGWGRIPLTLPRHPTHRRRTPDPPDLF